MKSGIKIKYIYLNSKTIIQEKRVGRNLLGRKNGTCKSFKVRDDMVHVSSKKKSTMIGKSV